MPKRIDYDTEQLRRLYCDDGLSLEEVAARVGLGTSNSVARHLRQAGVEIRRNRRAKGWPIADICRMYWEQGKTSEEVGSAFGLSATHVRRILNANGGARPTGYASHQRRGELAPRWKGGRCVSRSGYVFVYCPGHPCSTTNGYAAEHRRVMSDALGRKLARNEEVHHIDGNKANNSLDNLSVIKKGKHQRLHAKVHRELLALRKEVERLRGDLTSAGTPQTHGTSQDNGWKVVG
jgi:hypothetical protein